jgi:hypothetical protein
MASIKGWRASRSGPPLSSAKRPGGCRERPRGEAQRQALGHGGNADGGDGQHTDLAERVQGAEIHQDDR